MGDRDQTLLYLEQANRECPETCVWHQATVHYLLGEEYASRNNREQALQALENCLKLRPADAHAEEFPWKEAREAVSRIEEGRRMESPCQIP